MEENKEKQKPEVSEAKYEIIQQPKEELAHTRPEGISVFDVQTHQVTNQDVINTWFAGKSGKTLEAYGNDLDQFAKWCGEPDGRAAAQRLLQCTQQQALMIVLQWKNHMMTEETTGKDQRLTSSTINRRLAAVRSLLKMGRNLGLIDWEIQIPNVKQHRNKDVRGPDEEGFQKLLETAEARNDAIGARNAAMIYLAFTHALRRSEFVTLDMEHVDLKKHTIRIKGKGQHDRKTLKVPDKAWEYIQKWLNHRGNDPGALFCSFNNADKGRFKRLDHASVNKIFKKIGKAAGEDRNNPHGLRHSSITKALQRTQGNLAIVSEFSRHKSVNTLMNYWDSYKDHAAEISKLILDDEPDKKIDAPKSSE